MTPPKITYENGQTEALTVTPLSNTERYKFIDLMVAGDTPGIIALCARRNAAWVNSLTVDSFADLARYFFQEVFPTVMRLAARDPIAGLKIAPFQMEYVRMLIAAEKEGLMANETPASSSATSPSSSTTPSSDGETGSASPSAPAPADSAPGTTSTT